MAKKSIHDKLHEAQKSCSDIETADIIDDSLQEMSDLFKIRYIPMGTILFPENEDDATVYSPITNEILIIGVNGKVYAISDWAYDGSGGYELELKDNYEVIR